MNDSLNQQLEKSVRLLALEQEVRQAADVTELSFLMVNSSQALLTDATIIYWRLNNRQKVCIERVSNIANIDPSNTPLLAWLTKQITQLHATKDAQRVHSIVTDLPSDKQVTI